MSESCYVVSGGSLVSGDELRLVEDGYLVVRDGVILEIGQGSGPHGLPIMDATGCLIVPGLINGHTHLEDASHKELGFGVSPQTNVLGLPDGLRHIAMAKLKRSDHVQSMRSALTRALRSGTVAIGDFRGGGTEGIMRSRDAVEGLPLELMVFTSVPLPEAASAPVGPVDFDCAALEAMEQDLEHADGLALSTVNSVSDKGLRAVRAIAARNTKPIATHTSGSVGRLEESLRLTGVSDTRRAIDLLQPDFVVHMTSAGLVDFRLIRASRTPLVICPRSMASLGRSMTAYPTARSHGVAVALGTDNAMIASPDLLEEMSFLSRIAHALTEEPASVDPTDILRATTVNAARALGIDDRLGSLREGKAATFLMVDLTTNNLSGSANPVASFVGRATSTDIRSIVIAGDVISIPF